MQNEKPTAKLPKAVWQLGWISFFADICSEMAYPILPLFMAAILTDSTAKEALGIVEGISESIVSFMKGASGVRTDVTGRRVPYIQAGYLLSALGKPVIGLARVWPVVLVGRALDRFGKGIRTTARDTLIVDATSPDQRGRAFGLHRALDTAGAFTGVLFTLLLLYLFQSWPPQKLYSAIFFIAFVPGLISVWFTLRIQDVRDSTAKGEARSRLSLRDLPAGYWKAVAITSVFAIANSSDTFLIFRAREVFGARFGAATAAELAIWAYALYNVVYSLISYPAGSLSDRIGRWWVLGAGWTIYALVYLGFGFAGPIFIWLLFAVYGIYIGMTDGVSKALVADFSPAHARGSAMGLFYMVTGFCTLAASGLMGLLYSYSTRLAFETEAGIAMGAVMLMVVLVRTMRR